MRTQSTVHPVVAALATAALLASWGCGTPADQPAHSTAESLDPRTPVPLPADAQQAVLREMRQLLGAIGGGMAGAASGDTAAVIAALVPAGSAAAADPALETLLPQGWKVLAERTHSDFDSLVAAVRNTRGPQALKDTVLVRLARVSGGCLSCHETYRVTIR